MHEEIIIENIKNDKVSGYIEIIYTKGYIKGKDEQRYSVSLPLKDLFIRLSDLIIK